MKPTLALLTALLLAPLAALRGAEPVTIDLAKRTWQGIPGLERTATGRVYVSWFTGGTKEPEPDGSAQFLHTQRTGVCRGCPVPRRVAPENGCQQETNAIWRGLCYGCQRVLAGCALPNAIAIVRLA